MDKDEILRLKQITGLAALFKDVKFGQAWQPIEASEEAAYHVRAHKYRGIRSLHASDEIRQQ